MSEYINNVSQRKQALKNVIKRLHDGESVDTLRKEFGDSIRGATAGEIAEAERALISEGVSVSEIQRLCDLHVAIFRENLDEEPAPESLPGHPIFTFQKENEIMLRLLEAMQQTLDQWQNGVDEALDSLRKQSANLSTIEKHYSRKENILFPYLEKKGFEGPATVMWGVDNDIRQEIKSFRQNLAGSHPIAVKAALAFETLSHDIREMIYKEEKILFPEALSRLNDSEWAEIRAQEAEIGYFNVTPEENWQPMSDDQKISEEKKEKESQKMNNETILELATGKLSQKQINLMLTHLPIDVTFVDEHDQVRYFSQGRDRIFDRSPAIIGRPVEKCHPPQSVHRVRIILDDFKSGKRDMAEFWIQMGSKFIHIRYFALRDAQNVYQGCIEVTQDIAPIKALEGEKRLLDDAPGYEK